MSVLLGRLYAMREQLDAVIDAVEQEGAPPKPTCEHPEDKRKYSGVMGDASFTCGQCGAALLDTSGLTIQGG